MFSTLESSWDKSARRGWSAAASFAFQAMALSLLLVIPMFWIQVPPTLHWFQPVTTALTQPPTQVPVARERQSGGFVAAIIRNVPVPPRYISRSWPRIGDNAVEQAPDLTTIGVGSGQKDGVLHSIGVGIPVAPQPTAPPHRLKVSHWADGNLIYRVQPMYPPLARQARIEGAVQLRAIISKSGTIERLALESGHPMLAGAALEAVRQWRYRPYLLNDQPVEIETEITVNFLLSGK
jgi:protein TonB